MRSTCRPGSMQALQVAEIFRRYSVGSHDGCKGCVLSMITARRLKFTTVDGGTLSPPPTTAPHHTHGTTTMTSKSGSSAESVGRIPCFSGRLRPHFGDLSLWRQSRRAVFLGFSRSIACYRGRRYNVRKPKSWSGGDAFFGTQMLGLLQRPKTQENPCPDAWWTDSFTHEFC